ASEVPPHESYPSTYYEPSLSTPLWLCSHNSFCRAPCERGTSEATRNWRSTRRGLSGDDVTVTTSPSRIKGSIGILTSTRPWTTVTPMESDVDSKATPG